MAGSGPRRISKRLSLDEAAREARSQFLQGNRAGAAAILAQLSELAPDFPPARLLEAEMLLAGGDARTALALLGDGLAEGPAGDAATDLAGQASWALSGQGEGPTAKILQGPAPAAARRLALWIDETGIHSAFVFLLDLFLSNRAGELDKRARAAAHASLGLAYYHRRDLGRAVAAFRAECACDETRPEAWFNLGTALAEQGDLGGAEAAQRRALAFNPAFASAHHNLGNLLWQLGRTDEAAGAFEQVLKFRPDHDEAALNLGFFRLGQGDYAAGWPLFERRWRTRRLGATPIDLPDWDGKPFDGRLVVAAEQGLGDSLHFVRFLPALAARQADLEIRLQAPLLRLCRESFPDLAGCIVEAGAALPPADARHWVGLMSLAHRLGVRPDAFSRAGAYLRASPERAGQWKDRMAGEGPAIGLVWSGSPDHRGDAWRSIHLRDLEPVLSLKGARLFSLQLGPAAEQAAGDPRLTDHTAHLSDLAETAAAIQNLDLVISVDTAVAHLTGALGRPGWVLIGHRPDWRWGRAGETTAWYPSLRLFREAGPDGWGEVASRLREALVKTLSNFS